MINKLAADFRTALLALLVSGVGGYFSSVLAMRDQVIGISAKQEAMKEEIVTLKQQLSARIDQVDSNSAQRRSDTREELINQLQNIHSEMSELRQQIYKRQ